ncbi:uncharacterized protein LOC143143169 [Ptiloglossa arizonensis]|uniref:uncharacterized protein LOC143143169 n=1 Tax=Ptiloglossa arizonensis TaxID=3350558 RepID=UPI003F9F5A91
MGNHVSKIFPYYNGIEKEEIDTQSSTDEVTMENDVMHTSPVDHKILSMDPRSVTSGVDRTPIEVYSTPVGLDKRIILAIPKRLQTKSYLETDIDTVMPCLTPKKLVPRLIESPTLKFPNEQNKNTEGQVTPTVNNLNTEKLITSIEKERHSILGLDPRSPAADFDRTPILMPKSIQRLKARSQEYLHRRGSYETDVFQSKFVYCEMLSQLNVLEIQALPDLAINAIQSSNLLKTNYSNRLNESDLSHSDDSSKIETNSNIGGNQIKSEDENEIISEQNNHNDVCTTNSEQQKEIHINNNDTVKVWRDSLVFNEPKGSEFVDMQVVQENVSQLPKEEVIITFDDNTSIKDAISLKISKSDNEKKRMEVTGKKKVFKSEVKIATDEKKPCISNDKNGIESTKNRTPLGNRSNKEQMQSSMNSPQQTFRSKSIIPKMFQENTPPHKRFVVRSKLNAIQWDPDSTVII